jgi:hypothetical protein
MGELGANLFEHNVHVRLGAFVEFNHARLHQQDAAKVCGIFRERPAGNPSYGFSIPLCAKGTFAALQRCAVEDGPLPAVPAVIGKPGKYFLRWAGAKYDSKALIPCRAELVVSSITITISIARREAAENFLSLGGLHGFTSHHRGASTNEAGSLAGRMSKMSRLADGGACREDEVGIGIAQGAIYLRQMWVSGRRASQRRFARNKRARSSTKLGGHFRARWSRLSRGLAASSGP